MEGANYQKNYITAVYVCVCVMFRKIEKKVTILTTFQRYKLFSRKHWLQNSYGVAHIIYT